MGKSKSSHQWLRAHFDDEFVKRAQHDGYRSRAVYKLEEIQQKDRILRAGSVVVDLGAAPGGWSQYAVRQLGTKGRIFALDILPMDDLPGVEFIEGDFRESEALDSLMKKLDGAAVDLVMSDMAPNISGNRAIDQPRSMYLVELALDACKEILKRRGDFICKLFQGEGCDAFIEESRRQFGRVKVFKPKASRAGSREVYLVARNYQL